MKPVFTNVIAGLLGMALGWVVVGDPLSAMFAPTQVTWDATSCPAGVYNVTSTAHNMSTGESKVTSSPNVTLPRDSFSQVFPDLPAGTYSVTAVARRSDGETFGSASQVLTGLGGPSGTPAPGAPGTPGNFSSPVRSRPPSTPAVSRAQPRRTGGSTPLPGLPRVGAPSTSTPVAAKGAPPATKLAAPTNQTSPLVRITLDDAGNLIATDADWRRLSLTDLDADGRYDVVTIELLSGDIWIIHLKR